MDKKIWSEMKKNKDIVQDGNEVLTYEKYETLGENNCVVCIVVHSRFTYKGTKNDDIAVITAVLGKVEGKWKHVHSHRSSGRKPADPKPVF